MRKILSLIIVLGFVVFIAPKAILACEDHFCEVPPQQLVFLGQHYFDQII